MFRSQFRRTRNVSRPQPPSKPRYIAVAMAAGMFAIVPVSRSTQEEAQQNEIVSAERDGLRQIEDATVPQALAERKGNRTAA